VIAGVSPTIDRSSDRLVHSLLICSVDSDIRVKRWVSEVAAASCAPLAAMALAFVSTASECLTRGRLDSVSLVMTASMLPN